MKIAAPPRPVPHSTRSPGDAVVAHRVEALLEVVERESRPSPCTGSTPCVVVARRRARRTCALVAAADVSLRRCRVGSRSRSGFTGSPAFAQLDEVLDAQLVLEVVLVEQRALEQVEVALGEARRCARSSRTQDVVLERSSRRGRMSSASSSSASLPCLALELVEHGAQRRAVGRAAPPRRRSRARSRSGARPGAAAGRARR